MLATFLYLTNPVERWLAQPGGGKVQYRKSRVWISQEERKQALGSNNVCRSERSSPSLTQTLLRLLPSMKLKSLWSELTFPSILSNLSYSFTHSGSITGSLCWAEHMAQPWAEEPKQTAEHLDLRSSKQQCCSGKGSFFSAYLHFNLMYNIFFYVKICLTAPYQSVASKYGTFSSYDFCYSEENPRGRSTAQEWWRCRTPAPLLKIRL